MSSVVVFSYASSMASLAILSLDRFWAIYFPFSYSARKSQTVTWILVLSWTPWIVLGILPIIGWNRRNDFDEKCMFSAVMDRKIFILCTVAILTTWVVMLCAYSFIFVAIRKQVRHFCF
jgi:hypothetical protein